MRRLWLLLVFISINSCDTTEPTPHVNPPGYQEQIKWPSLADSPWPMYRADPQNSGRGRYPVRNSNFAITNSINCSGLNAGVALSSNTIYFNSIHSSVLYSYDKNSLNKNWEMLIGYETITTPLIAANSIYTTAQNILYAFDLNGDTLWTRRVGGRYVYQRTLNIDKAGNVYILSEERTLYKFSPAGELLNQITSPEFSRMNATAFSPDGKTLYLRGENAGIIALDINNFDIRWTYGNSGNAISPVVDSYGNIYSLQFPDEQNNYLISVNSEGILNWKYEIDEWLNFIVSSPAIGKYGSIYCGADTLYSISYKGELEWKIGVETGIAEITTDASGNVLIGTFDNRVLLISSKGVVLHEVQIPQAPTGGGMLPIVVSDDAIYAPLYNGWDDNGDVYILK